MGYILSTAGLSKLVLATDVPNTNADDLTHFYHDRSDPEIANGHRFFYCHGLAIALLSMAAISFSHEHKIPADLRVPKMYRLANRVAVCIILFFLPLAHDLSSLHLISITVGLVTWVLLVEILGKSCREDPFWGHKKGCSVRYSAKCSKKQLENCTKADGEIDVVELGRGEKTAVDLPS
jgi:hypothetical protein